MLEKIAVVVFNLGGPDSPQAVKPFLFNLFSDRAIIDLPQPFRFLLAKLISSRRNKVAQGIYAAIGGRSPIVPETQAQMDALAAALAVGTAGAGAAEAGTAEAGTAEAGTAEAGTAETSTTEASTVETAARREFKLFMAMRHWHPFACETAGQVAAWGADTIVLLPLYPHYSTTTSESSIKDWLFAARRAGLSAPMRVIYCYPTEPGFIAGYAALIRRQLEGFQDLSTVRVLLSAHGLPKKIVEKGDPYQSQVELTAAALEAAVMQPGLEFALCYQSRVGPLQWIGPSVGDEISRAGLDKKNLLVVPLAFVSEHSETLVELDIECAELAQKAGIAVYRRVPAVGTQKDFIAALAGLVRRVVGSGEDYEFEGGRVYDYRKGCTL